MTAPNVPDDTTKPAAPVNPQESPPADTPTSPAEEPKPAAPQYMTVADFHAAMEDWQAKRDAAAAEAAKKTAPAPKPKPAADPVTPAVEPGEVKPAEEAGYGSKRWFNRR